MAKKEVQSEKKHKAGYTANIVESGWAGTVMWKASRHFGRSSDANTRVINKCVRWTDRRPDGLKALKTSRAT